MLALFLAITIDIDPTFADFGPFTLTWHGLFTALGIIAGVAVAVWLAKRDGIPPEVTQEIALVAVPSAIVGARLFYVFEHWSSFSDDPITIITDITEGGITLYGGLLGGVLGGLAYALWRRWPIAITLDAAAPGMVLGQAIGRIGDLINGEHHADETGLPWAVKYTNPNTLGELGKEVHPTAGGYELLGDLLILAVLLLVARRLLRVPGWLFASYIAMYGILRFFLSYTRADEQTIGDVPVPQIVSGVLVGTAIVLAGIFMRWPGQVTPEYAERVWGGLPEDEGGDPPSQQPGRAARV